MAWLLCIAALLALPILWSLVPALRLPILPVEAATTPVAIAPMSSVVPPAATLTGSLSPNSLEYVGWRVVLLVAYALGAVTLLLRLVVGRQMLARLWRDASAVRDAAWDNLLSQLSAEMGLSRRVALRISQGPAMPMTWGTLAPKVLLPAEASVWPPERRRLVLLHELAHVARRDSLSRSVASLACALYWFHPGAWFAARQMRMEQEHAADDRVLTVGGSAEAYALSLLHVARAMGGRLQHEMAATMAGTGQLERRLVSITSPARRDRPGMAFLSSTALLAILATLVVATGVPVSPSSTPRSLSEQKRAGNASPIERSFDFTRDEDRSSSRTRMEMTNATQPGSQDERGRLPRESEAASISRREKRAPEREGPAGKELAQRDEPIARESPLKRIGDERGRDRRQTSATALPLRDYGWELPQRAPKVQVGSLGAPSPPTNPTETPRSYSASREQTGRPKWAQVVPRLVPDGTSTRFRTPASKGPLMLSWSIGLKSE